MIRGSCATALGRALSSAFWLVAALRATTAWIEYVKSGLNAPDHPSRMCPLTDKPAPEEGANAGVPRLFFDIIESLDSLTRAQFRVPSSPCALGEAWPCAMKPLSPFEEANVMVTRVK